MQQQQQEQELFAGDPLPGLTSPSDLTSLLSKMDPGTLSTLLGAPAGPLLEQRAASLLSMEQVGRCCTPRRAPATRLGPKQSTLNAGP